MATTLQSGFRTKGHNIENWVQNEMTDGHKSWKLGSERGDGWPQKLEQQISAQKLDPEQDDGLS